VSSTVVRLVTRSTAVGWASTSTTSAVWASGPDATPTSAKAASNHPKLVAPAARSSAAAQPVAPQTSSGRRRSTSIATPATGSTSAAVENSAWSSQPTCTTDSRSRAWKVGSQHEQQARTRPRR
jgi:hypothetical protein